ncbi:hypothetical protein FE782_09025 [Paenibacillus antri]|uniref:Pectate lyase superfamily protein domain-containing protein n=1 Tax=Paenibacillus antri TaxID=2582848 RepID=A0A5R9G8M1_9BACL|nr:hypothetical protein [Paenibacillus antri]TLS52757.1 hypothetical protein FE782_09025 [Paenibacillus antri]
MKSYVQYEDFGAVGDGVTDDMAAIREAHQYANARRLPVRSRPNAEYYIGAKAITAIIETDTDWSTSRFVVDDRTVENCKTPCFEVRSALQPFSLPIQQLNRDQKKLDFYPERECYVKVTDANRKKFIRFGLNQNKGTDQTDCFILGKDGRIASPIDWNYEQITEAVAWPIDETLLTVQGGIFTTIANQAQFGIEYYGRGILISRSNTIIDGMTHYVVGEGKLGSPYRGFLNALNCANVTFQNCFLTGHKIYWKIGNANLPVAMGSYDMHANSVVNLALRNCRMNHITDKTRWGVIATNFCKNISVEHCKLSRLDAHMGVSGSFQVRNSELGWQGINAIGRGTLTLRQVTFYGGRILALREDYGSTWEGNVTVADCKWVISDDGQEASYLIRMQNNGMHEYGYPCTMPETIEITNVSIDDSALPDRHEIFIFEDPSANDDSMLLPEYHERPYPYIICKKVTCSHLTISSRKGVRISKNDTLFRHAHIEFSDC